MPLVGLNTIFATLLAIAFPENVRFPMVADVIVGDDENDRFPLVSHYINEVTLAGIDGGQNSEYVDVS